jgi:hypothetical protein
VGCCFIPTHLWKSSTDFVEMFNVFDTRGPTSVFCFQFPDAAQLASIPRQVQTSVVCVNGLGLTLRVSVKPRKFILCHVKQCEKIYIFI